MGQTFKRKVFTSTSRYQNQIIWMVFMPTLVIYIFMAIVVTIMHRDMIRVIMNFSAAQTAQFINQWTVLLITGLFVLLIFILGWSFVLSGNLVGAFERIIKELDIVIEKKEYRAIKAREKDVLANELLKRINILIERYSQQ